MKDISLKWRRGVLLEGFYSYDEAMEMVGATNSDMILPTREDMKELIDNTTYRFDEDTKEGVFMFKDGYELRLPANGSKVCDSDSVNFKNKIGNYWSSTSNGPSATFMYFNSVSVTISTINRMYSFSICCLFSPCDNLPINKGEESFLGERIKFLENTRDVINGEIDTIRKYLLNKEKDGLRV